MKINTVDDVALISRFHIHNLGIELYHSLSYAHLFLLSLVEYLHENHIKDHLLVFGLFCRNVHKGTINLQDLD